MVEVRIGKKRPPEFFCTGARKVEPVGGDCVRIYCSVERDGVWDDQFEVVMPINAAIAASSFVSDATKEIISDALLVVPARRN